MELLTNRYRNLTVLGIAVVGQLLMLGYQVRSQEDVRLVRVWAVTAVTEISAGFAGVTSAIQSVFRNYIWLVNVRDENQRLAKELADLKLEAQHLRSELGTAERAQALNLFQSKSPSRTIAARIIGAGSVTDSKVVFIDIGTSRGVQDGMAVITADGLVGRVRAAYPTTSQVIQLTDPSFAAGVISQKHRVQGTLKGYGRSLCRVDYVHNEEKVDQGEWFYTSGDDRMFPRGLPVGPTEVVQKGNALKEILLTPSFAGKALEEVLVVLEPVHQPVPDYRPSPAELRLLVPPPHEPTAAPVTSANGASGVGTDADRLLDRYKRIGEVQGHVYGQGALGTRPPDFNVEPGAAPPVTDKPAPSGPVAEPNASSAAGNSTQDSSARSAPPSSQSATPRQ